MSDLANQWHEYSDEKEYALRGLSIGLIVTISEEITNLVRRYYALEVGSKQKTVLSHLKRGPKIGDEYWSNAVFFSANYVRHSYEWCEKFLDHPLIKSTKNGRGYLSYSEQFCEDNIEEILGRTSVLEKFKRFKEYRLFNVHRPSKLVS